MSVPLYKRKESKTQFLYDAFVLCKDISQILVNKPKKYKASYCDYVITTMLSMVKHLRLGNMIYVHKDMRMEDFYKRKQYFETAIGEVISVSTAMYIFLELCRNADGIKLEKLIRQEERVGQACESLIGKIKAVIKSDKERIQ